MPGICIDCPERESLTERVIEVSVGGDSLNSRMDNICQFSAQLVANEITLEGVAPPSDDLKEKVIGTTAQFVGTARAVIKTADAINQGKDTIECVGGGKLCPKLLLMHALTANVFDAMDDMDTMLATEFDNDRLRTNE